MTLSVKDLITEADRCVACGLCLPHCPTYRKTGSEADSPRGRIQLMRAVAQEILPNNDRFKEHIDLCLSCRSCESVCPNSVNYGALLDTSRALYIQKKNTWLTITKPLLRNRKLIGFIIWPLWLVQQLNLMKLLRYLIPAAKILPVIHKPVKWKPLYAATENRKGAVSLFLGCAGNALDSQTILASIYVLNKLGFDIHIPNAQSCCGSIARHAGDSHEASELVNRNKSAFNQNMPVLTTASGCGAGLKDYLPAHNVQDISAFLMLCDWTKTQVAPLKATIYVQDPCSLRNVQQSQKAVYDLLKKIPDVDIQALPGNSQCCGGAGAYTITQPQMANTLRQDKLIAIKNSQVSLLVTSNIGCNLHLANGLREINSNVRIMHPIEILAQQMGFGT
jgi:glycolate oxidase iron-sulfur subunit